MPKRFDDAVHEALFICIVDGLPQSEAIALLRSDLPPTEEIQLPDMQSRTVKTTQRVTGFSKDTIYDLLAAGEIRGFLMGSRRYIDAASLRDYIARRASEPLTIRRAPKPRTAPPAERCTGPQTGSEPARQPERRQKSLPFERPSRPG